MTITPAQRATADTTGRIQTGNLEVWDNATTQIHTIELRILSEIEHGRRLGRVGDEDDVDINPPLE